MNVRLSSQFSHEHLKLSNVHGKIGKKALNSFCQHFIVHSFPSHLRDPINRFVHTYYYQIIFGIIFMFMRTVGQNCHFNFHSKESSLQLKFHYREFKTIFIQNQRLLQKVLINEFLEHDGMRVLSSALFSSCMIGCTMITTLPWQKYLILQRSWSFVRKNLFFHKQTEKTLDVPDFLCVTLKHVSLK